MMSPIPQAQAPIVGRVGNTTGDLPIQPEQTAITPAYDVRTIVTSQVNNFVVWVGSLINQAVTLFFKTSFLFGGGNKNAAAVVLSAHSLSFGAQVITTTSPPQTITLTF